MPVRRGRMRHQHRLGGGRETPPQPVRRPAVLIKRNAQFPCPGGDGADGVGAGEEEPVIAGDIAEGAIERSEAARRLDFEQRHFDRFGAEGAEAGGEFAGLVRGAGNEDAAAGEGWGHGMSVMGQLSAARRP